MDKYQWLVTGAFTLLGIILTTIFAPILAVERFKAKLKKRDEEELERSENSKERLVDNRLLAQELFNRLKELDAASKQTEAELREIYKEKIALEIDKINLGKELDSARRLNAEQHEEIIIKLAVIEQKEKEIKRLEEQNAELIRIMTLNEP